MIKQFITWYIRRSGGFWFDGGKVAIVSESDFAWLDRRESTLKELSSLLSRAQGAEREAAESRRLLEMATAKTQQQAQLIDDMRDQFETTVAELTKAGAELPDAFPMITATEESTGPDLAVIRYAGDGYRVREPGFPGGVTIRAGDKITIRRQSE